MAKTTLPTNYVDDVLNGAMDGKRRYREIPNADGTISLEDATTYDQIGNNFGASQVNLMNDNINQSFDANKMLKTMDEVNAVTQEGYGVDALVVKELNNSLTKVKTYVGDDGKLHFIDSAGADSVLPFSTTGNYGSFTFDSSGNITITTDQEPTEVVALFKSKSSSTYNHQAYYNKNHTSMNVKMSVSGNSFSINNNNSSGFGGSTGEYIWR